VTEERTHLVAELQALRVRLDDVIRHLQAAEAAPGTAAPPPPPAPVPDAAAYTRPPAATGGLLAAIDLSDDLRQVYLVLLRHPGLTLVEMARLPELQTVDDLPVLVRALARQGQLEKYQEGCEVKYRPVVGVRAPRQVPESIWRALE
jgi:hypothetical protein